MTKRIIAMVLLLATIFSLCMTSVFAAADIGESDSSSTVVTVDADEDDTEEESSETQAEAVKQGIIDSLLAGIGVKRGDDDDSAADETGSATSESALDSADGEAEDAANEDSADEAGEGTEEEDGDADDAELPEEALAVQELIDALPDPDDVNGENREDVESLLETIAAELEMIDEEAAGYLDLSRYEDVLDALEQLDGEEEDDEEELSAEAISFINRYLTDEEATYPFTDEQKENYEDYLDILRTPDENTREELNNSEFGAIYFVIYSPYGFSRTLSEGESAWNRLSEEDQAAINKTIADYAEQAGSDTIYTYPEMLDIAKTIQCNDEYGISTYSGTGITTYADSTISAQLYCYNSAYAAYPSGIYTGMWKMVYNGNTYYGCCGTPSYSQYPYNGGTYNLTLLTGKGAKAISTNWYINGGNNGPGSANGDTTYKYLWTTQINGTSTSQCIYNFMALLYPSTFLTQSWYAMLHEGCAAMLLDNLYAKGYISYDSQHYTALRDTYNNTAYYGYYCCLGSAEYVEANADHALGDVYYCSTGFTNSYQITMYVVPEDDDTPEGYVINLYKTLIDASDTYNYVSWGNGYDYSVDTGNMYSLSGAKYGVYSSRSNAQNQTNRLATIITNTNGYGYCCVDDVGTYYVREYEASDGCQVDDTIYTVTISADGPQNSYGYVYANVNVTEEMTLGPFGFSFQKRSSADPDNEDSETQSLEGAILTIEYYDNKIYSEEDFYNQKGEGESVSADARWIFTTVKQADGSYAFGPNVEGSLLESAQINGITFHSSGYYVDDDGKLVFPIGSYRVIEWVAPEGYLADPVYSDLWGNTYNKGDTYWFFQLDADGAHVNDVTINEYGQIYINGALSLGNTGFIIYVDDTPDDQYGYLQVIKDIDPDYVSYVSGNSAYDLSGTKIGIYDTDNKLVTTLGVTQTGNTWKTEVYGPLEVGTYYVRETSAGTGYELNSKTYTIDVTADNSETNPATETIYNIPELDPFSLTITKTCADEDDDVVTMSMAGAVFEVSYYNGYYNTVSAAESAGATRTWYIQTIEENGEYVASILNNSCCLNSFTDDNGITHQSDELYLDSNKAVSVPYGTIVVKEVKAPDGYLNDPEFMIGNISYGDTFLTQATEDEIYLSPTTGNTMDIEHVLALEPPVEIRIHKYTADDDRYADIVDGNPMYDLTGTTFKIYLSATDARNDNNSVGMVTVDSSGYTNTIQVPYTNYTYYIKETEAGKGYILDTSVYSATVGESKLTTIRMYDTPGVEEPPVLTKTGKDGSVHKSLDDTYFSLTYYSGVYSTESSAVNAAISRTWYFKAIKQSDGSYKAGFDISGSFISSFTLDGKTYTSDAIYYDGDGNIVIPYGTIVIKELGVPDTYVQDPEFIDSNGNTVSDKVIYNATQEDGLISVSNNSSITKDVSVTNTLKPDLETHLFSPDEHENRHDGFQAAEAAHLTDTVDMTYLYDFVGKTVTVRGTLYHQSTGEPVVSHGAAVTAEWTGTITGAGQTITQDFSFDASGLEDWEDIVAYEEFIYNGTVITAHGSLGDESQISTVLRRYGSIQVLKTDAAGNPLAGVTYALEYSVDNGATWNHVYYYADGETDGYEPGGCSTTDPQMDDGTITTGSDGIAYFDGLYADGLIQYRITEIHTADGYSLLEDSIYVGTLYYFEDESIGNISEYDMNGDGIFTSEDCRLLERYVNGESGVTLDKNVSGDLTGDSRVTSADVTAIYSHYDAYNNAKIFEFHVDILDGTIQLPFTGTESSGPARWTYALIGIVAAGMAVGIWMFIRKKRGNNEVFAVV